jgi:hypothetical protein
MSLSFKPIKSLLQTGTSSVSRWLSYIALGIGVLLLFCSIQMLVNIHQLLKGNIIHKGGYDYISVTKKITLENVADYETSNFNEQEIDELKSKPFIADATPLISTQFQLEMIVPGVFTTPTTLYVEGLKKDFIDTVPSNFQWHKEGDTIRLIISSQFFEVFNALARSNGMAQISTQMAATINIQLTCHSPDTTATYPAKWSAFSDRINTVLAPEEFVEWANMKFGGHKADHFARVYVKTKNADDKELLHFLTSKGYKVNKDRTKLGGAKQMLEGVFTGLAVFGLLVVLLALMLFSFYLQLVVAKSRESLQLLLAIGYSPKWLGKNLSQRFIPVYILIILIALSLAELMQWAFHQNLMFNRPELISIIDWKVAATALVLMAFSIITNDSLVKRLLRKLGSQEVK